MKNKTHATGHKSKIDDILNRKYWIFDLDGTLTVAVHDFPAIRAELGIPANADILKFIDSQDKKVADIMLEKLDRIEVDLAHASKPAEAVLDLMNILSKQGIQLGIITRNTKENARISLQQIGILQYFEDKCIMGRMEAPPKPDPAGINKMLSNWNTTPDQAVMVGDYLFDLQTGKAVGAATIHVSAQKDAVWPELTDIHATSITQLVQMLVWQNDPAPFEN